MNLKGDKLIQWTKCRLLNHEIKVEPSVKTAFHALPKYRTFCADCHFVFENQDPEEYWAILIKEKQE